MASFGIFGGALPFKNGETRQIMGTGHHGSKAAGGTYDMHEGHRQRLKDRFLSEGINGFEDHNVLELLLFYAVPRRDTNLLAHRLLNRFGGYKEVFDAPYDELLLVEGVSENVATLIKLAPASMQRYMTDGNRKRTELRNSEDFGEYIRPYFFGLDSEVVYLVCLDSKCTPIDCRLLMKGSVNSTQVSIRKIIEIAIKNNAVAVILAHNHPAGLAIPSEEDVSTTNKIKASLSAIGVAIVDHIIIADDGDYVSMKDSGFI